MAWGTIVKWAGVAADFALAVAMTAQNVATVALTFVTGGYTAAQNAANAAVWAFPVTWIVAAIIGVIVAVIGIIIMLIKWATATGTVAETVVGIIYWVGAVFYNVGIGIWNVMLWLVNVTIKAFYWMYNQTSAVGTWLSNTYNTITVGIANFFISMINFAIRGFNKLSDGANSIANSIQNSFFSAINAISKMVEGFVNGFLSGLNEIGKVVDGVIGTHFSNGGAMKINIPQLQRSNSSAYHASELAYVSNPATKQVETKQAPQFDSYGRFKDMGTAFDNGKIAGKGLMDKMTGIGNELEKFTKNPFGIGDTPSTNAPGGGGGDGPAGKKTADNTGRMADSMDNSTEDLKYLRDIAEQDYVNKFTTAEIKLEIKNENSITSDVDVDSMLDKFEERIIESVYVAAEGVHE